MAYTPVPDAQLSDSSNMAHFIQVYHRRTALDQLLTTFLFSEFGEKDLLPQRNGRTYQWFRWNKYSGSTTAKTEGAVGTSLNSPGSRTVSCQVAQYSDFVTVSDMGEATAPSSLVDAHASLLGYRAGISVDNITRGVIDDQAAGTNVALIGSYLTIRDLSAHTHRLMGVDVMPFEGGLFATVAHPYVTYDVVNDPAVNGLADLFKHTDPNKTGLIKITSRTSAIITAANTKLYHSTNVAHPSASTWRVYTFGKGAYGIVDLEGMGPQRVVDPSKDRFGVKVVRSTGNSVADPEGVIAGFVAYKFAFGTAILDGPTPGIGGTFRYITVSAPSSIVA